MINRVLLIVLDSAGIGEMPDAAKYGDQGSNTIGNIAANVSLNLRNMQNLGLGNILSLKGIGPVKNPQGAFGKMAEKSPGKDTTTGHWEIAGIILDKPFRTYPDGFPKDIIKLFEDKIGRKTIGNVVASGTEIIERLGPKHIETGYPIVYTSADSVFQVAAHEEVIPLPELYKMCKIARSMLVGENAVGRVIARPFIGKPGDFSRTSNRHDYSLEPPSPTMLELIKNSGFEVVGIGKISDIYAGKGLTQSVTTKDNLDGINKIINKFQEIKSGLVFANLVDFDSKYGHRNNVQGYAEALEEFDQKIPEILKLITPNDILIITADHGCDPTTQSTDHSREYVPLLIYGPRIKAGYNIGVRESFSDLGATITEIFKAGKLPNGISMLSEIVQN
ncbi:phosphopentomutase [Bacillota bacterium LX-D]|nr:phosphopentomutase [Bacillota bacterium LX-D]